MIRRPRADERRAGFEPATVRLCRPLPWAARAPAPAGGMVSPTRRGAAAGAPKCRSGARHDNMA